ncbi:MAG: hypothetical protein WAO08_02030 [Hyphomicrobiaceae bacterium]
MDQTPRDLPPRTGWDRATRTDDGSWSVLPLLLVVAVLAIGAWMLFADSATPPTTTTTSQNAPASAPSMSPSPTPPSTSPSPTPTAPPANTAPPPATKP